MAGLYVHIPFCVKKCEYCDFVSFEQVSLLEGYFDALLKELTLAKEAYPFSEFETVFIGGGTPSLLTGDQMQRLFEVIHREFSIKPGSEITVEANPGTLDEHKLQAFQSAGINRLSIGVQSFDDGLLKRIGRIHTSKQAKEMILQAKEAGFGNINLDLMSGLPGQTQKNYLESLKQAVCFEPAHISAYTLILEEGTPLAYKVQRGMETLPDEDQVSDMFDAGVKYLASEGYLRYEISNFAREGFECKHNLGYWSNGEYLGVGLAAHGAYRKEGWQRYENVTELHRYLTAVEEGKLPIKNCETIPQEEEMFECIMLGLRTVQGVDKALFYGRFSRSVDEVYAKILQDLYQQGYLEKDPDFLRLTPKGLDLNNRVIQQFLSL